MRTKLKNRRLAVLETVQWAGTNLTIDVGFDDQCNAREVFVDGFKAGHTFKALLDDAGVVLSRLLQSGTSAADLATALKRQAWFDPANPDAEHLEVASLIGFLALHVARMETELKASPEVRWERINDHAS